MRKRLGLIFATSARSPRGVIAWGSGIVLLIGLFLLPNMRGSRVPAQEGGAGQQAGTIAGKVDSTVITKRAAVVYVKNAPGQFAPPKENPVMDQQKLVFIPHVLTVLKGSTVNFPNSDVVRHNVFSPPRAAKVFNLGVYPAGSTKEVTFEQVGVVPLLCNIHAEMSAFIVVLPNPYYATTDKEGNFTIEKVPPGNYELAFWHERLTPQTEKVSVAAGKTTKVTFSNPKTTRRYSLDLLK